MNLKLQDLRDEKIKKGKFKATLQNQLPRTAYFYRDAYNIAYTALRLIKDITVKKTFKSIDKKSEEVLLEFFGSISSNQNLPRLFILNLLDLHEFPVVYKQQLEVVVKYDLSNIDALVGYYDQLDFIKKYRTEKTTPRNHEEKTILEFYNRTIKKRNELIDYMIFKLDDRAIEKAQDRKQNAPLRRRKRAGERENAREKYEREYEISKDFPYRDMLFDFRKRDFTYSVNFEWLDYRKINPAVNKYFLIGANFDVSKGYSRQFYASINSLNLTNIFRQLLSLVKELPIVKERYKVFLELRNLFRHKQWYGFYSLALPQIEGIFSEMLMASKPSARPTNSLADKVQQIRPFYRSNEYSFDYYEYYLPNERNSFSHSGKVQNVKQKCQILLLDLLAIVKVFEELDSAVIGAKKILKQGPLYITDIGRLSNFFHLIELTKTDGLYNQIEKACNDFVYKEMPGLIDFQSFIRNLSIDFENGFKKYSEEVVIFSSALDGQPVNLTSLFNKNFQTNLKRLQEVHKKYSFIFEDHLKLLLDTYYVINNITKLFPLIDADIRKQVAAFGSKYSGEMKVIKVLDEKLNFEIPDDFKLLRKELVHYLGTDR